MIAALLVAAMSRQGSARTVELTHGATVPYADSTTGFFGYWDSSDTYIDGSSPDDNLGGEPILAAGPAKTILIRFGDLNRVLGPTRRIRKASLILTIAGGDKTTLKSVDRVLVPWGPGPYFTVGALINRAITNEKDQVPTVKEKPNAPRWSATWKRRLSGDGGAGWQGAGANGPQDSETIKEVHQTVTEKEVTIEGLASTFQFFADHPNDNFGLGIQFLEGCEFFSSRAATGRPRLELELEPVAPPSGPDLSVTSIERITASGGQPRDGEEITYKAHVKNVGTAKAGAFTATWIVSGKSNIDAEVTDLLSPGSETTVNLRSAYRLDKTDHRTRTVELKITPKGPDVDSANNSLLVYENARQIDVSIPGELQANAPFNLVGSKAVEDWVQEQVRIFNDTYAAQSRFSFAPEGAKERVSVRHILLGGVTANAEAHAVAVAAVPADENTWEGSDPVFLRSISLAIGLPDFTTMNFPAGSKIKLKSGDKPVNRGSVDLFPGVVGYGDTRYEGFMAGGFGLLYEPFRPNAPGMLPLVPSGLLSATDVAILNAEVDHSNVVLEMPKTTLVKASDLLGRPLNNLQLDFFQSKGGQIPDGAPAFSVTTGQNEGTALLPNATGLGPYGKLDPDGGNGTFLIRATANGVTEWGWLKAWQLIDTASRGNRAAGVLEVRFDLPTAPLDAMTDLARDRIITDSTNQLPAKLGPLVGGGIDKDVTLGGKTGDWVEIDLGRDRTIGEITLLGNPADFWPQFDILVYSTGQKASEATPWASELNWKWTASNRRDVFGTDPSVVSVAYRAPELRIRFIRIINRSASVGKLKAIRVVPIKI